MNGLAANKLSLNVKKSKLLIFSNKHIVKDNNNTEERIAEDTDEFPEESEAGIYINGEKLNEVDHAKYLGVLIDNKLNWSFHINDVSLKISKGAGLLAKLGITLHVVS